MSKQSYAKWRTSYYVKLQVKSCSYTISYLNAALRRKFIDVVLLGVFVDAPYKSILLMGAILGAWFTCSRSHVAVSSSKNLRCSV